MVECELNDMYQIVKANKGFNRYMVECEWLSTVSVCDKTMVLIDTWWNVNHSNSYRHYAEACVLIDTWWNVNKKSQNL